MVYAKEPSIMLVLKSPSPSLAGLQTLDDPAESNATLRMTLRYSVDIDAVTFWDDETGVGFAFVNCTPLHHIQGGWIFSDVSWV